MGFSAECYDEHFCHPHRPSRCYDLKMGSFTSIDRVLMCSLQNSGYETNRGRFHPRTGNEGPDGEYRYSSTPFF